MKVFAFALSFTLCCFTILAAPLKQVQNAVKSPFRTQDTVTDTLNAITADLNELEKSLDNFWLPRAIDAVPILEGAEKLLKNIKSSMSPLWWSSSLGLLSSAAILGPVHSLDNAATSVLKKMVSKKWLFDWTSVTFVVQDKIQEFKVVAGEMIDLVLNKIPGYLSVISTPIGKHIKELLDTAAQAYPITT